MHTGTRRGQGSWYGGGRDSTVYLPPRDGCVGEKAGGGSTHARAVWQSSHIVPIATGAPGIGSREDGAERRGRAGAGDGHARRIFKGLADDHF